MHNRRPRPRYLTSKASHIETMEMLRHMHEHLLHMERRTEHIMPAIDDLKREVTETREAVLAALAEMQKRIDDIKNNPGDEAAVAAAAAELDQLQTDITAAITPPTP